MQGRSAQLQSHSLLRGLELSRSNITSCIYCSGVWFCCVCLREDLYSRNGSPAFLSLSVDFFVLYYDNE